MTMAGATGDGSAKLPQGPPIELPLFRGINCASDQSSHLDGSSQSLCDVILYAGGPIWSLDWRPSLPDTDGQENAIQYLAVCFARTSPCCAHKTGL